MKRKMKTYAVSVAIALSIGLISALLTRQNMNIYSEITTPPLSSPSILFPIVWTVLYLLMGISAAMIFTNKTASVQLKNQALSTYATSLVFNFLWSIIFFNMRAFALAFVWILILLALIIITIRKYRKIDSVAAYLQIPYALWVTFAAYLNAGIWMLNK